MARSYVPERAEGYGQVNLDRHACRIALPLVVHVQGSSTEAGIRQMIGADKACLIDEFESDQNRGRMQSVLRLVRSSSSAKSTIARGTVEGKAIQYQVYCAFLLGAIIPIKGSNADQSRIVEPS